jgi:uncharacterized protein YrrD
MNRLCRVRIYRVRITDVKYFQIGSIIHATAGSLEDVIVIPTPNYLFGMKTKVRVLFHRVCDVPCSNICVCYSIFIINMSVEMPKSTSFIHSIISPLTHHRILCSPDGVLLSRSNLVIVHMKRMERNPDVMFSKCQCISIE